MNYLNKETTERHPHADLIIQWANNPNIKLELFICDNYGWVDCHNPVWDPDNKYRIKPEPKPDVIVYTNIGKSDEDIYHSAGCWRSQVPENFLNSDTYSKYFDGSCGIKYKVITKLKLTYDGETGKLKEVVEI